MIIRCPKCQTKFSIPDRRAGKVVACPKCTSKLKIPPAGTPQPSAAQAAVDPFATGPQTDDPFASDPLAGFEDPLASPENLGQPVRPISRRELEF